MQPEQFDRGQSRIGVSFIPLWMDVNGEVPKERKVLFVFHPIGRFIARISIFLWEAMALKGRQSISIPFASSPSATTMLKARPQA